MFSFIFSVLVAALSFVSTLVPLATAYLLWLSLDQVKSAKVHGCGQEINLEILVQQQNLAQDLAGRTRDAEAIAVDARTREMLLQSVLDTLATEILNADELLSLQIFARLTLLHKVQLHRNTTHVHGSPELSTHDMHVQVLGEHETWHGCPLGC